MSAFFFPEHEVIFNHIPKNGGSTIRGGQRHERHLGLLRGGIGPIMGAWPKEWPRERSFAFIRDPIARFRSGWQDKAPNWTAEEVFAAVSDPGVGWRDLSKTECNLKHHLLPQTDERNHVFETQYLLDFDRYNAEVKRVFATLGLPRPLYILRLNKSPGGPRPLPLDLIPKLADFYAEDFALWHRVKMATEADEVADFDEGGHGEI